MIASPTEARPRRSLPLALALACLAAAPGCTTFDARVPEGALLEPLAPTATRLPDEVDRAAVALATAALVGERNDAEEALAVFERTLDADPLRSAEQRDPYQLMSQERPGESLRPLAIDLANATRAKASDYRRGAKRLLERSDLNAAHRGRLEESAADDPLALARARINDHRESLWARTFNAASQPLGQALLSGLALAPYTLAQSAVHYLASLNERPAISIQERQALAHWKRYVEMEPDAPDAAEIEEKIDAAQRRLDRHFAEQYANAAELRLEAGDPRAALAHAERALAHRPDDRGAERTARDAREEIAKEARLRARSLEAPTDLTAPHALDHELAVALWTDDREFTRLARRSAGRARGGRATNTHEATEFGLAGLQAERGHLDASFERLHSIASLDPERSTMARHAAALVVDPLQNPYGHFVLERRRASRRTTAFRLLGPWSQRPRYRSLPKSVSYLIDAPAIAQAAISAPLRLLVESWEPAPDFRRPAALAAYRSLARHPQSEHRRELLDWLYDYETDRQHWNAALRVADHIPGFDPEVRSELAEQVAEGRLSGAERARRPDVRGMLLRSLVRDYPETTAGRSAGDEARQEALDRSPQRIRLTRGFLSENASVAGPSGLGLRAELLDGSLRNGELHPEGVTFRGGREIEIALVPEGGEEDDDPVRRQLQISGERLSRSIAQLEEAARVGAQIDRDDDHAPDAQRDQFFERARLGLEERPDVRPAARSTFVYRGLRERYGLVRGRSSILPFDLVLQGSLIDLRLGAYPRWREPEPTPDAFLYR